MTIDYILIKSSEERLSEMINNIYENFILRNRKTVLFEFFQNKNIFEKAAQIHNAIIF
jgi:hypothetical protein